MTFANACCNLTAALLRNASSTRDVALTLSGAAVYRQCDDLALRALEACGFISLMCIWSGEGND